ncbi:hypothetical protein RE6C_04367 [Rhodopirellula europaea 6C]|uniref:Uncharacterized protein n=1 Tax=Rhodopirellula europaea 6C TaxID=1263867 RepID=M2AY44_9BACT|nr:hypothetical protein RE6C_04367 [Rhodopirellula europaea 6C]
MKPNTAFAHFRRTVRVGAESNEVPTATPEQTSETARQDMQTKRDKVG